MGEGRAGEEEPEGIERGRGETKIEESNYASMEKLEGRLVTVSYLTRRHARVFGFWQLPRSPLRRFQKYFLFFNASKMRALALTHY